MAQIKQVRCPHCNEFVNFERSAGGRWAGTIAGGGMGFAMASRLGIAGKILGAPIAIPAALVGLAIGALLGNRTGAVVDSSAECPNCGETITF